jgi:hypothetical protein
MKTAVYAQHFDHAAWINKLKFYRDEITILTKRLEEISSKNNRKDVLALVDHFQNQFLIQENNINNILHLIKRDEKKLTLEMAAHPVAVDHKKKDDHFKEREDVETFEKSFNDLRTEFKTFAAKWM